MTKSEEWEQFSAYRPMIEDARLQERKRFLKFLEEEESIGQTILKKEDCNADCYKCDIAGHVTVRTVKSIRAKLEGNASNENLQEKE